MSDFVGKEMSLLFNMLSRFIIALLPRSKRLSVSWLQSPSAVVLEPPQIKSQSFHCFPIYLPWSDGTGCHDLSFLNVRVLSQPFHSPLSPSSRGSLVLLHFLPLGWYHLFIWGYWYFSQKTWFQLVIQYTPIKWRNKLMGGRLGCSKRSLRQSLGW